MSPLKILYAQIRVIRGDYFSISTDHADLHVYHFDYNFSPKKLYAQICVIRGDHIFISTYRADPHVYPLAFYHPIAVPEVSYIEINKHSR